jgi:hypothetical protein
VSTGGSPNQLAGPVVPFVVTDWHFGTENRLTFASISEAIEAGEIDPRGKRFEDVIADAGIDSAMLKFGAEDELTRPEPSPLGLSSLQPRK